MGQITLRAARTSIRYTEEEIARFCGISVDTYRKFEFDSSLMPVNVIRKISSLFDIPLALIHIGPESDYINSKLSKIK